MKISVGVFAYNEGGSIEAVLDALVAQVLDPHQLIEIIVVSFGSTDQTNEVVRKKARRYPIVRLEVEPVSRGKAVSVSRFLACSSGEILVMMSGDAVLRSPHAVLQLVEALQDDSQLGIIGARHRIINHGGGFVAFAGERVWSTLHLVSTIDPKISGDLMAMRSGLVNSIPPGTLNDDVYLEFACLRQGYQKGYCPLAEVFIRIPENINDYVNQRRRIYAGHRQLRRLFPEYSVSTTRTGLVALMVVRQVKSPRDFVFTLLMLMLDLSLRLLSELDDISERYKEGRWITIHTTKFPVSETEDM